MIKSWRIFQSFHIGNQSFKKCLQPGVLPCVCNLSTEEAEAEESVVQGCSGLHNEVLSQNIFLFNMRLEGVDQW